MTYSNVVDGLALVCCAVLACKLLPWMSAFEGRLPKVGWQAWTLDVVGAVVVVAACAVMVVVVFFLRGR